MKSQQPAPTPIVRFLGDDAGRGGPFALLGVGHTIRSADEIHRARLRRLRQIDCHPQRSTPDADEVRLAVHSAASQLLDPALREQLVLRWPEGTPVDLPRAWNPSRAMKRITPALIGRARQIVGSSGGWNSVARRRLAHLARLNRISAFEIVRELGIGRPGGSSKAEPQSGTTPLPHLPSEPAAGSGWVSAYVLLGLLASTVIVTLLLTPDTHYTTRSRGPASAVSDPLPGGQQETQQSGQVETAQRDRITHYTAIAHELDRLVARARIEPDASISRFREVYPEFLDQWTAFPEQALQRAGANIAEFIARLDQHQHPPDQIAPLLATGGISPDRVMIAAGVIDVSISGTPLRQETQDLLRAVRSAMTGTQSTGSTDIKSCIYAVAIDSAHADQGDDPDWWSAWLLGVKRASGSEADLTGAVLTALSDLLRDPAAPREAWRGTVSMLVRSLDWREESVERFWLISQFNDSEVQTERLAVLTEVLATESAASGVDQLMVLPRNANAPKREEIAKRYRDSWFPARSGDSQPTQPGGAGTPLLRELQIAVNSTPDNPTEAQAIEHLIELHHLTTAAFLAIDGHGELSEELVQNPPAIPDTPAMPQHDLNWEQADDAWAERAVNSEEAAQLRPYLDELVRNESIGISSAHALVYLATRKSQNELRELALAQIVRYADQIAILIAIDHALSKVRVTSRVDTLVREVLGDDIPSRNDDGWYPQVRSMLLARMGQAMVREQDFRMSQVQDEIASMLTIRFESGGEAEASSDVPSELLAQLNHRSRAEVEKLVGSSVRLSQELERIDAESLLWTVRARNPFQHYLAQQRIELALFSLTVRARYPDADRFVEIALSELRSREDGASSAIEQMVHTQRALAQLMQIELQRRGDQ